RGRDLARERPFLLGVEVLSRHADAAAREDRRDGGDRGEGRGDHDLARRKRGADPRADLLRQDAGLGRGLVHLPVAGHGRLPCHLSARPATPGSGSPARNSSVAPPPVETWVMRSARPICVIAATLSPPPTIVVALLSASAFATASVPSAKGFISNAPIGPF